MCTSVHCLASVLVDYGYVACVCRRRRSVSSLCHNLCVTSSRSIRRFVPCAIIPARLLRDRFDLKRCRIALATTCENATKSPSRRRRMTTRPDHPSGRVRIISPHFVSVCTDTTV
eukprot:scaffold229219_cov39-Attheya_sp.AAC.1